MIDRVMEPTETETREPYRQQQRGFGEDLSCAAQDFVEIQIPEKFKLTRMVS